MLHTIRYYGNVAALYVLTVGTIGATLCSSQLLSKPTWSTDQTRVASHHTLSTKAPRTTTNGKPVRIIIPARNIDLAIDDGHYDPIAKTWTLSPNHAQFAVMTSRANDQSGTTFIYGHGTDAVFGKIGSNQPPAGTEAIVHTENGHIFRYTLQSVRNLKPTDTSILRNTSVGPPQLVVQTCTGALSEWRTMFTFSFRKVD